MSKLKALTLCAFVFTFSIGLTYDSIYPIILSLPNLFAGLVIE